MEEREEMKKGKTLQQVDFSIVEPLMMKNVKVQRMLYLLTAVVYYRIGKGRFEVYDGDERGRREREEIV